MSPLEPLGFMFLVLLGIAFFGVQLYFFIKIGDFSIDVEYAAKRFANLTERVEALEAKRKKA